MTCPSCNAEATLYGYISKGEFLHGCTNCKDNERMSGTHAAEFQRNSERVDYRADMVQPSVGGKPNPDFIRLYPEQAKETFTQKEIEENQI